VKAAIRIVGMVAGGREHLAAGVDVGDPALLVPEPDNPHDPNAVRVHIAPFEALRQPYRVSSSITDPDRVGSIDDEDLPLLLERHVGYVPRDFAAQLEVPAGGIVGYVSRIRHAPPEYLSGGRPAPPRVVGFDVTAWWPMRTDAGEEWAVAEEVAT